MEQIVKTTTGRRGRPKGSKNKTTTKNVVASTGQKRASVIVLAENSVVKRDEFLESMIQLMKEKSWYNKGLSFKSYVTSSTKDGGLGYSLKEFKELVSWRHSNETSNFRFHLKVQEMRELVAKSLGDNSMMSKVAKEKKLRTEDEKRYKRYIAGQISLSRALKEINYLPEYMTIKKDINSAVSTLRKNFTLEEQNMISKMLGGVQIEEKKQVDDKQIQLFDENLAENIEDQMDEDQKLILINKLLSKNNRAFDILLKGRN
jgi:sulfur carrier protein ThiS